MQTKEQRRKKDFVENYFLARNLSEERFSRIQR